jgi:pSer/pThr/pTyr-binding forkhead associated (FHA) protein
MIERSNNLILIENSSISEYKLDNKQIWEIGRPSKDNNPDIKLHSITISRKHGKFENMDGLWFYIDYNGKNGTYYNHKHIDAGKNGSLNPILLSNEDVFVFGAGSEESLDERTIYGIFLERDFGEIWRVKDSKDYKELTFKSTDEEIRLTKPQKGEVVSRSKGMAIYMGDLTYMIGDMEVIGR